MKKLILVAVAVLATASCQSLPRHRSVSLFNGKDLRGWYVDVPKMDNNPSVASPFIVRDGMLVSLGTPGGHLVTDTIYQDYRLEVEYRFAGKPGNCGVLVHASTPRALYGMFPQSLEVQMMHENAGDFWCIMEDATVPDMEERRGPKEQWGISENKQRRIVNLTDGSENPRPVEHDGHRVPRQFPEGLGQRRSGQPRVRLHRRQRPDRHPGGRLRGRVPQAPVDPHPRVHRRRVTEDGAARQDMPCPCFT